MVWDKRLVGSIWLVWLVGSKRLQFTIWYFWRLRLVRLVRSL